MGENMTEQQNLISILKTAISKKKAEIKEYNQHLDQNLSEKIELLENLRTDINEITKVDGKELAEIINLFSLTDEEKEQMQQEMDIIKALLTLNQQEKTSYTLLPTQLTAISTFLEKLEEYIEQANQEKQELDPEYNYIITLTNHYKSLLSKIKNPKVNELITDIDTILKLLQEANIKEEEKQAILISIIKYNQEVVKEKEMEKNIDTKKLTMKELTEILEKYGYNFQKLEQTYQEELLRNGNRKNLEQVLKTMQDLEFPKFDEEKQGLLLITYLIYTTKETLKEITLISQERGINISNISELVSAFIPNKKKYKNKYKIGKLEDFKKNVKLLGERGISIPMIAEKEKELLVLSNDMLQRNLDWLERYGLYSSMNENALLDDFLCALKSMNIPDTIDLWIENHPLGLQYIKNNLSALSLHFDKNSLVFFKLHIAADRELQDAFRFTMSNGVKRLNLRKEVTKDQYDYHGITDLASAFQETEYKQPHFEKETQYNTLASKSKFCEISDEIFDKPEITSLNRFSNSTETLLYNINGLRVSKLKVLRIYDILCHNHLGNTPDALLYSICYNKIITEEEYRNLRKDIIQVTGWKGE